MIPTRLQGERARKDQRPSAPVYQDPVHLGETEVITDLQANVSYSRTHVHGVFDLVTCEHPFGFSTTRYRGQGAVRIWSRGGSGGVFEGYVEEVDLRRKLRSAFWNYHHQFFVVTHLAVTRDQLSLRIDGDICVKNLFPLFALIPDRIIVLRTR